MRITTRTRAAIVTLAILACGPGHATEPRSTPPDAVLPDGARYQGETREGRFHGEGRLEWPSGRRYEGTFVDGRMHGQGRERFPDGTVYQGEFDNGVAQGQGTLTYPTGRVFEGRFEQERIVTGVYRDGDGNTYEGEFKHWQFHGEGVYRAASGDVYRGTFDQGELQGEGVHEAPSGQRYEGEFRDWAYHGQGTLTQPDGQRYVGAFVSGYRHGHGRALDAGGDKVRAGIWAWGEYQGPDGKADERRAAATEDALYRQTQLLESTLDAVAPGHEGEIELYFVGVAPYGAQDVFRKEIDFVAEQFAARYDAGARSVVLGNHPDTLATRPMATRTSLERSLAHVAEAMNADEDLLFLYLTSHGSEDHRLAVEQPGFDLPDLTAGELASLVDDLPAKWKIVAVSACYAGGFLPPLQDEHTLVMTAARHDRRSFGCGDTSEMTYFGEAYFRQALPQADSFREAFDRARTFVRTRELMTGVDEHSEPQIAVGDELARHLEQWRQQREARAH